MRSGPLSLLDFEVLTFPLLGMTVSLARKSYGTTINLALGRMQPPSTPYLPYGDGEMTIYVTWDWRVEEGTTVLYGSSDTTPEIRDGIATLTGARIESLALTGEIPELIVQFSNGQRLQTMTMTSGDPRWWIILPNGGWLGVEAGELFVSKEEVPELSEKERVVFAAEDAAASRWGTRVVEPKKGRCYECRSFVRLASEAHLLDFGVCWEEASPFDGRALNGESGCPMFRPWPEE